MSGLKKRVAELSRLMRDDIGSQIVVKSEDKVLMQSKSAKDYNKLIRIIVHV